MAIQVTIMSIDFDSHEEPVTKIFNKNEITVGRKPGNDLVLDRPEVSGYHAKLIARPNGKSGGTKLYVMDLGSSNGTHLERDSLKPDVEIPILNNQRLIIGSFLIKPSILEMGAEMESIREEFSEAPPVRPKVVPEIAVTRTSKLDSNVIDEPIKKEEKRIIERQQVRAPRVLSGRTPFLKRTTVTPGATPEPVTPESSPVSMVSTKKESEPVIAPAPVVPPREDTLEASKVELFSFTAGDEEIHNVHFEADELFSLSGEVYYRGNPIQGVRVDLGALGEVETDERGAFCLPEMVEGTAYSVTLSKEGFLFEPGVFSGVVSSDVSLKASGVKLFSLSGVIRHRGKPLAGVHMNLGSLGVCQTSPDGTFAFKDIREGTSYHIIPTKEKFTFEPSSLEGTLDSHKELTLEATKLVTITGQVVHKGRPLAGVEIECINLGKAVTDENGKYVFENIPEGTQCVFAAKKAGFRFSKAQ